MNKMENRKDLIGKDAYELSVGERIALSNILTQEASQKDMIAKIRVLKSGVVGVTFYGKFIKDGYPAVTLVFVLEEGTIDEEFFDMVKDIDIRHLEATRLRVNNWLRGFSYETDTCILSYSGMIDTLLKEER